MKRSFSVGSPSAVKRTLSNFSIFSGISEVSSSHEKTELIELKTPVYFEIQEEDNITKEAPKVITKKETLRVVKNYEKRISKRIKCCLTLTNCTHGCKTIVNKKSREQVQRKCPGNHGTSCNGLLDFACFIANHRCKACECKCSNCII